MVRKQDSSSSSREESKITVAVAVSLLGLEARILELITYHTNGISGQAVLPSLNWKIYLLHLYITFEFAQYHWRFCHFMFIFPFSITGEKGIEFDQLDRPSSATSSATLPSRPSTAHSSRDASSTTQPRAPPPGSASRGPPSGSSLHNSSTSSANANESSSDPNSKNNPYALEGHAPAVDTKLEDVVDELPEHVLSRSGTPSQWAFDDKDASLNTGPPRPTSASLCSPPVPRKVPISVDHHLRK